MNGEENPELLHSVSDYAEIPNTEMNAKPERWRVDTQTKIRSGDDPTPLGTIGDFWRWSASDLRENTLRGIFAEYLVALKLGLTDKPRIEWEPYDLVFEDKKIEVKSSGYVQAWPKTKEDKNSPSWSVRPTKKWRDGKGWIGERKRRADVYVFCLEQEREPNKYEATDLSQWQFWVIPIERLDTLERARRDKNAKPSYTLESISKATFAELKSKPVRFGDLRDEVSRAINAASAQNRGNPARCKGTKHHSDAHSPASTPSAA